MTTNILQVSDDLQQMKEQLNLLTAHLHEEQLISDAMLQRSIQRQLTPLLPSRVWAAVALVLCAIVLPAGVVYLSLTEGLYSIGLMVLTVLMCLVSAWRCWQRLHSSLPQTLATGSLVEVARAVEAYKQTMLRERLLTALILVVWGAWFFLENSSTLLASLPHFLFAFLIIGMVTAYVLMRYNRAIHASRAVLQQLDALLEQE